MALETLRLLIGRRAGAFVMADLPLLHGFGKVPWRLVTICVVSIRIGQDRNYLIPDFF